MSKAKVLVLGGLRDDALTELKEVCDITRVTAKHLL